MLTTSFLLLSFGVFGQYHPYGTPKKKQPAWKGWEIHGAGSAAIVNYDWWTVSRSYDITDRPNSDVRFIRDDGTVINADRGNNSYNSNGLDESSISSALYQLGINRITTSGFSFRFSLGYYRTHFRMKNDQFSNLRENEIRTFTNDKEQSLFGEVGIHYNFFRRGRFRPYLGAHFTTHLWYDGSSQERFIEGSTGQTGLVESFTSKEYLPIYPDYSLTVGFQYQLTNRLSAGAFIWVNNGYDLWIDAPVGVEMRYSLWDRPLRARRDRE